MTDRIIREDLRSAAVDAARNILAALDHLDRLHRAAFLWDASCTKPGVLRSIADAVRGDDQPAYEGMSTEERLAVDLYANVRLVEGRHVVEELSDDEPWLTIRRAVWDLMHAIDQTRTILHSSATRQHSVEGVPRP